MALCGDRKAGSGETIRPVILTPRRHRQRNINELERSIRIDATQGLSLYPNLKGFYWAKEKIRQLYR